MHCPVGWQKQTQLSHKVAARCKWILYRLLKHTLIEYSAVVIFDPIWSQLSYKPLLSSKPKATSPLSPKTREKKRDFLNVRVSARDARLTLIIFLGTMICFESPFDSRVLLNKHAISLCQNESPLVIISGNWIQELDSVLLIHTV